MWYKHLNGRHEPPTFKLPFEGYATHDYLQKYGLLGLIVIVSLEQYNLDFLLLQSDCNNDNLFYTKNPKNLCISFQVKVTDSLSIFVFSGVLLYC